MSAPLDIKQEARTYLDSGFCRQETIRALVQEGHSELSAEETVMALIQQKRQLTWLKLGSGILVLIGLLTVSVSAGLEAMAHPLSLLGLLLAALFLGDGIRGGLALQRIDRCPPARYP